MTWQIEIDDESAGTIRVHSKTFQQVNQAYRAMADLTVDRIIADFVADPALLGGKVKYYNDQAGPKGLVARLTTTTGQSVTWTMSEI